MSDGRPFIERCNASSGTAQPAALLAVDMQAPIAPLGAGGFAALLARMPLLSTIALWAGIAYLACYGLLSLRAAIRGAQHSDITQTVAGDSLAHTLLATASV